MSAVAVGNSVGSQGKGQGALGEKNDGRRAPAPIAHLAETPFGFLASTFLPITPHTPKHLGFGVDFPCHLECAETPHLV
jgi:hypothetical protein